MATKTDRDFDLQQQNLDLKQEKLQMVDEMNKYKQQALMQQMELNKAKTAALLGDQGTWHEGGPMQFAQAGSDITGLAYSAPYREGGNYIELNKPFQAANPYQTPEAFNYTPKELTPPEEIEVSAQDQAELDSKAAEFYDIQKQLSSIKYSGNPKEKELRNRAAQIEYEYKKLSAVARDNYKWSMKGFDKGLLSSFDIESGYRRDVSNYDPAVVLKQFSEAITVLNSSLNRAVPGSANYNLLIRDRERMRNDLIRRRDTAPTKELAFSYQAEIDKLGRPTRDLAAEAEIEDKKRAWGKDEREIMGSAVYTDQLVRADPNAIAAFNARNEKFRLVQSGNKVIIQELNETVKTGEHSSSDGSITRGDIITKKWVNKGEYTIGDPSAFHSVALMAIKDEKIVSGLQDYYSHGKLNKVLSSQKDRPVVYINPELQEHIRKSPLSFARGLRDESLKNMFVIDGTPIKSVKVNEALKQATFTLSDGEEVIISDKDIESSSRFGLSNDVRGLLYNEANTGGAKIPGIYITGKDKNRRKINIYKKDSFSGSKGEINMLNTGSWDEVK